MPLGPPLRIWPQPIGPQCLLMLMLGLALGLLLPDRTGWLAPLASLFLQASQIVVMPCLIWELLLGFGHLPAGSLGHLIRLGGVVLVGQWLLAALVVRLVACGIFALVSLNVAHLDTSRLITIKGFFVLASTAFLLLNLLAVGQSAAAGPCQPSLICWRARPKARAPAGTSAVRVEPAATVTPSPSWIGATSTELAPVLLPAPITVRCLRTPS